jgi:class 3 adenylate cyclase
MGYNYKDGRKRILNILSTNTAVEELSSIPMSDSKWTYDNGIKVWVTAVFVDIRNSKDVFENNDQIIVSKYIRSFVSEVVEVLNGSTLIRETGIRGDAVYGIFSSSNKQSDYEIYLLAAHVNTVLHMLNKIFEVKGLPSIKAGIGIGTSQDLVVKTGRKGTGINDKVWIGQSIAKADILSKITNKNSYGYIKDSLAVDDKFYESIKEKLKGHVTVKYSSAHKAYSMSPKFIETVNWIDRGMRNE